MIKRCSTCKQHKSTAEFHKNRMMADGLAAQCKMCKKVASAIDYATKTEEYKARVEKRRQRNLAAVNALKQSKPCTDCGVVYDKYIMDYDHVLGSKTKAISKLVGSGSAISKIYEEIEKCELVCSNCHRYRTWNRLHPEEPIVNPLLKPHED